MSTRATDSAAKPAADTATATSAPTLSRARSLTLHRRCACGGDAGHGASCESCHNEKLLQRRSDGSATGPIPASVGHTLSQPGRPLDDDARSFMESRFAEDFSGVRVHDDSAAAQSARDVHAHAYTVGQDIVFAPGQYQPHSESGRHLLAHELAHTVQQRGLQRSGLSNLADQGPEYRRLEGEADRAADFAMRGGGAFSHGLQAASRPHLSRVPATGTAIPAAGTGSAVPITVNSSLMTTQHEVTPVGGFSRGGTTQAFDVDVLFVPATKGPRALAFYQSAATGHSLNAVLRAGEIRSEQWQQRDDTDGLRARWLNILGWTAGATANQRWSDAGGDATFPQVGGATCQMDHIIELQVSGNNTDENIQALDRTQNINSGGAIKNQVFGLARQIIGNSSLVTGSVDEIQLRFQRAEMAPAGGRSTPEPLPTGTRASPATCLSVEICARNAAAGAASAAAAAGTAPEAFPLSAGGTVASVRVPTGFTNGSGATTVPILANAENRSAAELMSGLLLVDLVRSAGNRRSVTAKLDTRDRTRVPITLEDETAGIALQVGALTNGGYALTLPASSRRQNLRFTYPYLSPGTITSIERRPDGAFNWSGEIRPTVPLLPNPMTVNYRDGAFTVGVPLNRRSLSNAIPGFTVTEAEVSLQLAPTLSASGHIAFSMGRGARPLATGTVDVGADSSGLTATGQIRVNVPGIDEVSGTITMRNGQWSGQIVVESTQIRIPNVQRGRLQLDIDSSGIRPSGEVELLLPRNLGSATIGVTREGGNFVFTGGGHLRVPGLDNEVEIRARYSNGNFRATASNISFTWRSFTGTLDVTYTQNGESPGRVTGTGTIRVARGNVRGSIEVTLDDAGRVSGRGTVSYPLTIRGTRIDASATIIVDPQQNVRVEGSLSLPQPIELFRSFGSERQLFRFDRSIPIPGLSVGPVGVVAVIEGGISAGYSFGPGQLRNVRIDAAFNPLAEHVNPDISFHCELHIPASASLTAMIGGGIGVEAGLARVRGTLRITARLALDAVAGGPLDVRYHEQVFSIRARPGISAALVLGLSLDANARAEAGFGPFTVGIEKTWNLGRRDITLGRFSVYAPISYTSDAGLQVPSMDELEWGPIETPEPANILSQLFNGATATQRETPT